jgi:hypothetical protein
LRITLANWRRARYRRCAATPLAIATIDAMTSPAPTTLNRLEQNILLRLGLYYAVLAAIGFVLWKFLPEPVVLRIREALQPLVGQEFAGPGMATQFTQGTGAPLAMAPRAVILMTVIAGVAALAFTVPVSWVYMFTRQKKGYSQSVVHSLVLLPVVVAIVAALVRNSIALAFSLAGVVAAVRFRTTLEDSKDAVFVFAVVALGLAAGVQLEVAAVLSVLFVIVTLVLWYTDFARTPPALEGQRAEQHMQRVVALANRTSQFVAKLDREILESMAPAQLDALESRLTKRRSELTEKKKKKDRTEESAAPAAVGAGNDESGPRFDGRMTFTVSDPDMAQPAIEALFETLLARWKMIRLERQDGQAKIVYAVRPKTGATLETVAQTVERDGAPYVARTEVERWI